jgi:hypothetical protein
LYTGIPDLPNPQHFAYYCHENKNRTEKEPQLVGTSLGKRPPERQMNRRGYNTKTEHRTTGYKDGTRMALAEKLQSSVSATSKLQHSGTHIVSRAVRLVINHINIQFGGVTERHEQRICWGNTQDGGKLEYPNIWDREKFEYENTLYGGKLEYENIWDRGKFEYGNT